MSMKNEIKKVVWEVESAETLRGGREKAYGEGFEAFGFRHKKGKRNPYGFENAQLDGRCYAWEIGWKDAEKEYAE